MAMLPFCGWKMGCRSDMRVIKWILSLCHLYAVGHETQIGWLPYFEDFNTVGLGNFGQAEFEKVMKLDRNEWRAEPTSHAEFIFDLCDSMPKEFTCQRELIIARMA